MQQPHSVAVSLNGTSLEFSTGLLAKQATAAVTVTAGETVLLATIVVSKNTREGIDYLPLMVDYEEKMYSAGKIPGSRYIKREGRPSERAVVTGRQIDRPLRPLFPQDIRNDLQVIVTILSADPNSPPDVYALNAAATAVLLSGAPFDGPVAAVRVGRVDGQFVLNPTYEQIAAGDLDIVVAGDRKGVVMLEGLMKEVPEAEALAAIEFARGPLDDILKAQEALRAQVTPIAPAIIRAPEASPEIKKALEPFTTQVRETLHNPDKLARETAVSDLVEEIDTKLSEQFPDDPALRGATEEFVKKQVKYMILHDGKRPDGRGYEDIRPITAEVALLPRTHGSALFTRGQTQVLTSCTLGGLGEEQLYDTLTAEEGTKRFLHHYNFPPYSVGEVKPLRGASRRDIGHGNLVERALTPIVPIETDFPYTIRLVSEVLESNGSSSMASTCAATLALMDAGVPIPRPVAGISIGLVRDEGKWQMLTDIQGVEDSSGDLDLKIAGTRTGITAIQMDVKGGSLTPEQLKQGFSQALRAREFILDKMATVLAAPRADLKPHAPRVLSIQINPERIGELIGPGGKVIKRLEADYGVKVDVEQDGRVYIVSSNLESGNQCLQVVTDMMRDIQPGEIYTGKVTRVAPFGAIVEFLPGRDGMVHISELDVSRVEQVEDIAKLGDEMTVKVISVEDGKIRLSRRALLPGGERERERSSYGGGRPRHNDHDRGGRSGPRRGPSRDRTR